MTDLSKAVFVIPGNVYIDDIITKILRETDAKVINLRIEMPDVRPETRNWQGMEKHLRDDLQSLTSHGYTVYSVNMPDAAPPFAETVSIDADHGLIDNVSRIAGLEMTPHEELANANEMYGIEGMRRQAKKIEMPDETRDKFIRSVLQDKRSFYGVPGSDEKAAEEAVKSARRTPEGMIEVRYSGKNISAVTDRLYDKAGQGILVYTGRSSAVFVGPKDVCEKIKGSAQGKELMSPPVRENILGQGITEIQMSNVRLPHIRVIARQSIQIHKLEEKLQDSPLKGRMGNLALRLTAYANKYMQYTKKKIKEGLDRTACQTVKNLQKAASGLGKIDPKQGERVSDLVDKLDRFRKLDPEEQRSVLDKKADRAAANIDSALRGAVPAAKNIAQAAGILRKDLGSIMKDAYGKAKTENEAKTAAGKDAAAKEKPLQRPERG